MRNFKAKKVTEPVHVERNKGSTALVMKKKVVGKRLDSFEAGNIVLAKQKYSVPWPARILTIRSKQVDVYFYGDGRSGPVNREEIYSFNDSHDVILDCLRRKIPTYSKGIREVEMGLGIPAKMSLTRAIA